jgi:hypothetical protein
MTSRVRDAIGGIGGQNPICARVQGWLVGAEGAGNIRLWTDGPSYYDPDDYWGDAHRGPGVVHLTQGAFDDDVVRETLIHEALHQLGYNHGGVMDDLVAGCMGDS